MSFDGKVIWPSNLVPVPENHDIIDVPDLHDLILIIFIFGKIHDVIDGINPGTPLAI